MDQEDEYSSIGSPTSYEHFGGGVSLHGTASVASSSGGPHHVPGQHLYYTADGHQYETSSMAAVPSSAWPHPVLPPRSYQADLNSGYGTMTPAISYQGPSAQERHEMRQRGYDYTWTQAGYVLVALAGLGIGHFMGSSSRQCQCPHQRGVGSSKDDTFSPHITCGECLKAVRISPDRIELPSYEIALQLDEVFRTRKKRFFSFGKVFKVLLPAPSPEEDKSCEASATSRSRLLQCFVVVEDADKNSCICLTVSTYEGWGVSHPSITKEHHAIMFSGDTCPDPLPQELPNRQSLGMGPSIEVKPKIRDSDWQCLELGNLSRINFIRCCRVLTNTAVHEVGDVKSESKEWLLWQYLRWQKGHEHSADYIYAEQDENSDDEDDTTEDRED